MRSYIEAWLIRVVDAAPERVIHQPPETRHSAGVSQLWLWPLALWPRFAYGPALGREDRALARRLVLPFPTFRPPPPRLDWMPGHVFGVGRAAEDDAVQLLQTIGEIERLSVGEAGVERVFVAHLELFDFLRGKRHAGMIADGRRSNTAVVWLDCRRPRLRRFPPVTGST